MIKNIFNINDLVLCDCDLNDIDEAITMQKEEIIYWNKTGYNPNKIWDGYKIEDESTPKLGLQAENILISLKISNLPLNSVSYLI